MKASSGSGECPSVKTSAALAVLILIFLSSWTKENRDLFRRFCVSRTVARSAAFGFEPTRLHSRISRRRRRHFHILFSGSCAQSARGINARSAQGGQETGEERDSGHD